MTGGAIRLRLQAMAGQVGQIASTRNATATGGIRLRRSLRRDKTAPSASPKTARCDPIGNFMNFSNSSGALVASSIQHQDASQGEATSLHVAGSVWFLLAFLVGTSFLCSSCDHFAEVNESEKLHRVRQDFGVLAKAVEENAEPLQAQSGVLDPEIVSLLDLPGKNLYMPYGPYRWFRPRDNSMLIMYVPGPNADSTDNHFTSDTMAVQYADGFQNCPDLFYDPTNGMSISGGDIVATFRLGKWATGMSYLRNLRKSSGDIGE